MSGARTVLILGGYGTFGGRLARLLAGTPGLSLLVAGRSREKAGAFVATLPKGAGAAPAPFDRDGDVEAQLRALGPDLAVDASGPFQGYGPEPYRVVEACLRLGIPYVDLADGADFVAGIERFDAQARERGVFVISGASTLPCLSVAVIDRLAVGLAQVETVEAGVAPSPRVIMGLSVMQAIASYAGREIGLPREGRAGRGRALVETRRFVIAPPGVAPLRNVHFSLVDVPDYRLLPKLLPGLKEVWMGAGTVPESLHRLLNLVARLVGPRLLSSLSPFAGVMHRASTVLRWGEHRGGMFVAVRGRRGDGASVERSWHLIAEGDHGPFIPAMAAALLVRRFAADGGHEPGARSAARELSLPEFEPLLAERGIRIGVRSSDDPASPLLRGFLGSAWDGLPPEIRAMHGGTGEATGLAEVERGSGLLARLVAFTFRLPEAGRAVPLTVRFEPRGDGEVWRRTFGRRTFVSELTPGRGRWRHLVRERFGPVSVGIALVTEPGRLRFVVRRWSAFGIPLPARLAPGGDTTEHAEDGRFRFHVEIAHPLTGLIVRYRGFLEPRR